MFGIGLILTCVAFHAVLACEYTIQDFTLKPCDSKPTIFEVKGIGVQFNKDCNVKITGCSKITKGLKDLTVDYVGKKDGMQVVKGTKKACKEKLWDKEIKCPMPENTEICATDKWIYEVPKNVLAMAVGNIQGTGTVKTDQGNYCFAVTAKIKKN